MEKLAIIATCLLYIVEFALLVICIYVLYYVIAGI